MPSVLFLATSCRPTPRRVPSWRGWARVGAGRRAGGERLLGDVRSPAVAARVPGVPGRRVRERKRAQRDARRARLAASRRQRSVRAKGGDWEVSYRRGAQMGEREGPGIWHGPLAWCFCSAVFTGAGQERERGGSPRRPVFAPRLAAGYGLCWQYSAPVRALPCGGACGRGPEAAPSPAAPVPRPPPAPRAAGTSEASAAVRSPRAGGSRAVPTHPYSRSTAAPAGASPPARCLRRLRVLSHPPAGPCAARGGIAALRTAAGSARPGTGPSRGRSGRTGPL